MMFGKKPTNTVPPPVDRRQVDVVSEFEQLWSPAQAAARITVEGLLLERGHITEEHLDYQIGVDFKGVVFTVQKALPLLNDGGSIILNSSNTNAKASDGIGVYAAIKAALRSLARTWASELRDRKIRVNVVSPGATATPGIESLAQLLFPGPGSAEKFEEYQISSVPMAIVVIQSTSDVRSSSSVAGGRRRRSASLSNR